MPDLCMALNSHFSSPHRAFLMPPKTLDDSSTQSPTNNVNTPQNEETKASVLVFISAQAIGSVGLAMSILAIWFGWLLPASIASTNAEPPEIKKSQSPPLRHHRRPVSIAPITITPPTPMRRASAPVNLTPILSSSAGDGSAAGPRHVYFEDSSMSAISRRNTLPAQSSSKLLDDGPASTSTFTVSPLALTVELPAEECTEVVPMDSDSSPHSSKASLVKPSSRLHKLRLFGNGKPIPRLDLDKPCDQASIASTDTNSSEKSARRASGGFVASWTLSRTRTAPDATSNESHTPSPSRLSFARRLSPARPPASPASVTPTTPHACSPTFLTRKRQNRVSAPIPRTSPYGAPYFAAPPLLLDSNYPAYLKTLPQFEDEVQASISHVSDSDEPHLGRGRTTSIRRVNLNDSRAPVPKQRSASIDGTTRPNATS
ncbi:hypothetical protein BDN70DRAFT_870029 [Pholiota conissans]|uniref:Uncharacterized protein n=1 Tax=Pholiota conissans TaxID=109636 RepID=A0A9P6D866_9AGAR|nr:hypothetical protein BDN70DRAFT_870029 [Pholiota conissans]